jgi:hypothetical protein
MNSDPPPLIKLCGVQGAREIPLFLYFSFINVYTLLVRNCFFHMMCEG